MRMRHTLFCILRLHRPIPQLLIKEAVDGAEEVLEAMLEEGAEAEAEAEVEAEVEAEAGAEEYLVVGPK